MPSTKDRVTLVVAVATISLGVALLAFIVFVTVVVETGNLS